MPTERVVEAIRALPDRPGIYVFRDGGGRALYVGKAKSLRKRAANYLREEQEPRLAAMLGEAADLEFVETGSEAEALGVENAWIKKHRPHYNIRLRDDKTYPYVKLTLAEDYPRIAFTRRIRRDGAEYFGPYLPAGLARRAIKLVQKLFQVRICHIPIDGSLSRPCLYHDMHRCLGPCVAGLTSHAAYADTVAQARLFLSGRNDQLVRELRRKMHEAAETLEFEEAARLRDLLGEVEEIGQRRKLSTLQGEDVDVFGAYVKNANAAVTLLVMRGGHMLDRRELFWEGHADVSIEALLTEVVPQIYDRTTFIPKEIHLPAPIEGEEALAEWLSEKRASGFIYGCLRAVPRPTASRSPNATPSWPGDGGSPAGFMDFPQWAYMVSQADIGFNASFPQAMIFLPNKIFYYLAAGGYVVYFSNPRVGAATVKPMPGP
ncbi:MAG: excinuclease ABC subunit C [Thermoanaerobaculia bacterium]|nr:excinuclease ABC subunit C [Thermoanaerobaculia bacterium]